MLASLKGEFRVAFATGVVPFHQELVESASGRVEKNFILFSNFFFFLLSRSGLGSSGLRLTLLPQPVRNFLALTLPSLCAPGG